MKRALGSAAVLALACLSALPVHGQETKSAQSAAPTPMVGNPAAGGVKAEVVRQIEDAQKKLLLLAEATPAEKFGWRPAQGVRSVGEVYLHVAAANYFLPTFWGAKAPEGLDMRNMERDGGDKAKVVDTLKKSFDHAKQAIQAAPDAELEKNVRLFDHDATVRETLMVLATHAHEHLGQSIAYARMNNITPPWSAGGQ